ncbi:MAG: DMT family transporter [Clostridia bacterium]|nr:DMT family transporter [Clostridia bacterium]
MKRFKGELILLVTAVIWGTSFVAQSLGSDRVQVFTYSGVRNLIGALTLFIAVMLMGRRRKAPDRAERRLLLRGGALCGALLFVAMNAQQYAIALPGAGGEKALIGKVAFLTALYIVLVPVLGLFFGRKTSLRVWICVLTATSGAYLLTVKGGMGKVSLGDAFALLCSVMYAFQIIAVDAYAPKVDCIRLSMYQFAVCGALSMICAFIFEQPTLGAVYSAKWPLLYSGVMSSGVAYTLQMVGQKHTRPQIASLIMSLESVFSALSGYVFLGQSMTSVELAGCALMFAAVVLTQLPLPERASKNA